MPGLGLRVTANGAKAYIVERKLGRQTVRITIGSPRDWPLETIRDADGRSVRQLGARAEARRLLTLIDAGKDPRQEKAAAIAQAPSMATGWTAMRFGWASYIAPFLFVYSPAILMQGSIIDIATVTVTSLFGIWLVCAAMTGYFTRVLSLPKRMLFAAAGIMLLSPHQVSEFMLWLNIAGAAAGIALIAAEFKARRTYAVRA